MPEDMQEIVTVEQVQRLFLLLAVLGPVVGAAIGAAVGMRRGAAGPGAGKGLLVGLVGPANLALWTLYNAITDRLGLDTVKNLLVNLALFALIGAAVGLVVARTMRPGQPRKPEPSHRAGATEQETR